MITRLTMDVRARPTKSSEHGKKLRMIVKGLSASRISTGLLGLIST